MLQKSSIMPTQKFLSLLISFSVAVSASPVVKEHDVKHFEEPMQMEITECEGYAAREVDGGRKNPEFSSKDVNHAFEIFDEVVKTFSDMMEKLESMSRRESNEPMKLKREEQSKHDLGKGSTENDLKQSMYFKRTSNVALLGRNRRDIGKSMMDVAKKGGEVGTTMMGAGMSTAEQAKDSALEAGTAMGSAAMDMGNAAGDMANTAVEQGGEVIASGMEVMDNAPMP